MGAGLKAHNVFKKKYPLIISDERVSLSHLNLMTLLSQRTIFDIFASVSDFFIANDIFLIRTISIAEKRAI